MERKRGLGALIPSVTWPEQPAPPKETEVPIETISANPYQPRQRRDEQKLEELTASVRQHGVVQPLVVRPKDGGYELIAGERRLEAARRAGLSRVPVVVRECGDTDLLELALVENLQREDINPVEAARAYRRLTEEFGLTQEQVAERVSKSRTAVANTLRLLGLPEQVLESIQDGRISEGHGRALLAAGAPEQILTLWRRVISRGMSVRQTEAAVRRTQRTVSRETPSLDPNAADVQQRLMSTLGTRVALRPRGKGGIIEITYYDNDDLDRIIARIAG